MSYHKLTKRPVDSQMDELIFLLSELSNPSMPTDFYETKLTVAMDSARLMRDLYKLVIDLDEHLRRGGPLPYRWKDCKYDAVAEVDSGDGE